MHVTQYMLGKHWSSHMTSVHLRRVAMHTKFVGIDLLCTAYTNVLANNVCDRVDAVGPFFGSETAYSNKFTCSNPYIQLGSKR